MEESPSSRLLGLFAGQRLTPTQRRIAQSLVEHAPRAGYLSSGEIAELAGVSQPSVTRFATAVGYDGYPALRDRIRELIRTDGRAETPDEARRNEWQRAVAAEHDNLTSLSGFLADPEPVLAAARVLADSRPLPVVGLRAGGPIAEYFGYFAAKVLPDVRVCTAGGSVLADRLEQAQAAGATALLTFVLPRYPVEALAALRAARAGGLRVVTITDGPMSPAAEESDLVLPAPVGAQLVFDLHSAPMVLAMVLLQAICDARPTETQARLESFERSANRRGLFAG
ncbi:MurR/RpiR family transcriptional regulator [Actinocatenispora rupis]|uniref:Transcriptional regulator n=1 Tax=Actinocatenispora rupis TaxID=519421 RepID=A0A8J3IXN1_9ACTN|nr:MurR/RpiR family transcriptional regulator [Actinocatenispora rupis]GID10605.1 transcriptional regulator [Actinocatenispora rupis]